MSSSSRQIAGRLRLWPAMRCWAWRSFSSVITRRRPPVRPELNVARSVLHWRMRLGPLLGERHLDRRGGAPPAQPCRFVERRSRQKPVAPAERRATGDAAAFGGFGHALPDDQGLDLRLPTLLLA